MKVEMKDSEIPWIGMIPNDWELSKVKRIMRNKSVRNFPNEMVLSLYRDYGVIPKDSRQDNHNVTSEDTTNYKFVEVDDFVINKMKAWQGSMGLSDYQGIISPAYYICKFVDNNVYSKYIHHLLRNETYKPEYMRLSTGLRVGQWDLGIDDFLNIPIIIPPTEIQKRIVSFLDEKCADIDQLISLQQRMIDELKAYKQSVITEAVCKGLDKSVPMKDSGIEWIGEVPEGWEVRKVSQIYSNIGSGTTPKSSHEDYYTEDGFNFLQTGDLNDSVIESTSKKLTDKAIKECSMRIYPKNSLVVALYGATIGKLGILQIETCTNQACCVLGGRSTYESRFGFYMFYAYRPYLLNLANGGGQPNISQDIIKSSRLLCPSKIEQKAIVAFLDHKSSQIDTLISIKQQKIEELKDYKKSMIYEYITGKKQVPND